jgi:type I restriction enzyme, S subunit
MKANTSYMELKQGYKLTEVGVIPEDWEVKELKQVGVIATGTTPPTNNRGNYGDEFFFVSPADLGKGKYIVDSEKKLSKQGLSLSRVFPSFSILFTCIGSTIGKSGISTIELTSNQQINAIFPNSLFLTDFVFYFLNFISGKIRLNASEQAVPMINKSEFGKTIIALPTLTEQTAIATALSDADSYIQSLDQLIAKKRLIKQGAMQELLKPKEGWVVKKLGDLGKLYGGLSGKSKLDFVNGQFPYIPFMNIMSNSIIDESYFDFVNVGSSEKQNIALKGDLFFNGSSETPEEVGMCSVLLKEVPNLYLNSFCFGFRLQSDLVEYGLFLSYFFRSSEGRKLFFASAQGATRYNLSKKNFEKLAISIPPPTEQTRIATILTEMDDEIQTLEKQLEKAKQIKQGMMQELLTGKTRLV